MNVYRKEIGILMGIETKPAKWEEKYFLRRKKPKVGSRAARKDKVGRKYAYITAKRR